MKDRFDFDRISSVYDFGRPHTDETLHRWRRIARDSFGDIPVGPIADIGSGTGVWSFLLQKWLDRVVVGIEPSTGMRAIAQETPDSARVHFVGGQAENLPLRDECLSGAWLSAVVHHFPSLPTCVNELTRTIGTRGRVIVRASFGDRIHDHPLLAFFPPAHETAKRAWPTLERTLEAFADAGWERRSLISVPEMVAPTLGVLFDLVQLRAYSILHQIPDEEFEQGLANIRRASRKAPDRPVVIHMDALVLGRDLDAQEGGTGRARRRSKPL